MKTVFADSSFWYALIAARDADHARARQALAQNRAPMVTTDLVVAETVSLLVKRIGKQVALQFGDRISRTRICEVVHVCQSDHQAAWAVFREYEDKEFDLVDACSFVVMRALGIEEALTLDQHFGQMGFRILL